MKSDRNKKNFHFAVALAEFFPCLHSAIVLFYSEILTKNYTYWCLRAVSDGSFKKFSNKVPKNAAKGANN